MLGHKILAAGILGNRQVFLQIDPAAKGYCTTLNACTKYPVSPKQVVGTPLCSPYARVTCFPPASWRALATESFRIVKSKTPAPFAVVSPGAAAAAGAPGMGATASSPSHVLQSHPR